MNGLLTTSQAAERLGLTRWRINALIRDGRLKATRLGQIFVINEHDLKAVENRRPGRPPKPKEEAEKSVAKQRAQKKDPTRLLKTLS